MKKLVSNLLLVLSAGALLLTTLVLGSEGSKELKLFPHDKHVTELELECEICHQAAPESDTGLDNLIPDMKVCLDCHDEDMSALYRSETLGKETEKRIFGYCAKFNHSVHVKHEVECLTCHGGIPDQDPVTKKSRPSMIFCISCHEKKQAVKSCVACHERPKGKIPANHVFPVWKWQHGDEVHLDNTAECFVCHERNDCQECHQGDNLGRTRAHPPGFEFKHTLEFRSGRTECSACHDQRSFCAECHLERNVYPRSHQRSSWANTVSGGAHRLQAEINIEQCVVCHSDEPDTEPVCAACHQGKSEQ